MTRMTRIRHGVAAAASKFRWHSDRDRDRDRDGSESKTGHGDLPVTRRTPTVGSTGVSSSLSESCGARARRRALRRAESAESDRPKPGKPGGRSGPGNSTTVLTYSN